MAGVDVLLIVMVVTVPISLLRYMNPVWTGLQVDFGYRIPNLRGKSKWSVYWSTL